MGIEPIAIVDAGLGNASYLLDLGDGRALAVDPCRDLRALRAAADRLHLTVAFAAETHLHADFVSGAMQLAAEDGARIVASARGRRGFPHIALDDGDEVDLGGLRLRVLATSGHTGEHVAYQLVDGVTSVGVFTGGSLIVGGAARTDLSGDDQTDALTRAQYRALRRLAELPDTTAVWPTHGAGSFCSAPTSGSRTSTIGAEKATNPLLTAPDEESFVAALLGGLGSYPAYFNRLAEVNRRGPTVVTGAPAAPSLDASAVRAAVAAGAVVVDIRPIPAFAAGHLPGAVSIALRDQFATWLGWLVDPATPMVLVRDPDQDMAEALWQAAKIDYTNVVGELAGGMAGWRGEVDRLPLVDPEHAEGTPLDLRQDDEFAAGHVPGAVHVELGELSAAAAPNGPTVVMCGHGERAMTGASLLQRAGHRELSVLLGGPDDWAAVTGRRLRTSAP
ncbi:MAG TPA: MBL fold metallo-hydrolase [Pseudonocardiaceae bacterium]